MGDFWIARSPGELVERLENFRKHLEGRGDYPVCWKAQKYRKPRSLSQNALLNVWAREYAQHVLGKDEVTEDEQEAMRITLQRACYAATHWEWLIEHVTDLFTGESKPQRKSTTKMDRGELSQLLDWIQHRAAEDGLILEAQGEYAELRERQVA